MLAIQYSIIRWSPFFFTWLMLKVLAESERCGLQIFSVVVAVVVEVVEKAEKEVLIGERGGAGREEGGSEGETRGRREGRACA